MATEKSLVRKACASTPKDTLSITSRPSASVRALCINTLLPRQTPTVGNTICASARNSARISAKWPSSGVIRSSVFAKESGSDFAGAKGLLSSGPSATGMSLKSYRDVLAACPEESNPFAPRTRGLHGSSRLVPQRILHLRRHVILVVLGQHFAGLKHAVV